MVRVTHGSVGMQEKKTKTIFTNGVIYYGRHDTGFKTCSTMIVQDGIIEYLGDEVDDTIKEQSTTKIDLGGRSVFATFFDGHTHLLQFGASLVKIALDDCRSLEDIRHTIATAARNSPDAERLLCRGWRQSSTNRAALASMIDDIDPRPIFIDADDLHSAWCNTAALLEMGIDKDTPDPVGGSISRDEDGNASGLISEAAVITLVWPHLMGTLSRQDKIGCMVAAINEYHASGYSGINEMAMDQESWELLEELHGRGQLNLNIAAFWIINPTGNDAENLAQVEEAIAMHAKYNLNTSPEFRITGIKVICDGVVDSCTAALSKPYLVTPNGTGDLIWTAPLVEKVAAAADAAQLQIALHAIGDAAIHMAVNTLESLGTSGRRHRIEHLELTHPDDAKRLGKLGITASIQPVHSDPTILIAWPELIGPERCGWAFAHKEFHDYGAQLAIGTDAPTAPHLPLPNMYVANTRTSSRDPKYLEKINDRPGLELCLVWSAATWGSAYSCFAEKMTGSLEVGKQANFILIDGLSNDLKSSSLLTAKVAETWIHGKQVYKR